MGNPKDTRGVGEKDLFCLADFAKSSDIPISVQLLCVDHHAPVPSMARRVSSANLALRYVRQCGVLPSEAVVLISHTDCDSVLAAGILRGILPPLDAFGEAVMAADHTGAPNDISDLLQSVPCFFESMQSGHHRRPSDQFSKGCK